MLTWMCCTGHSWSNVWSNISQLVVKSMIAVIPHLIAAYRSSVLNSGSSSSSSNLINDNITFGGHRSRAVSNILTSGMDSTTTTTAAAAAAVAAGGCRCFEVLGYDVLLDASLKPWLIEVNHSPSFTTDSALDLRIKEQLIVDTVQLVGHDWAERLTQPRLLLLLLAHLHS
jgi:hypothetical protein